jgi:hypothetical protein
MFARAPPRRRRCDPKPIEHHGDLLRKTVFFISWATGDKRRVHHEFAVNPDVIRAQVEGGVGYGLGAALRNKITLTAGVVDQSNFDGHEPLRVSDMPSVEVHIVSSASESRAYRRLHPLCRMRSSRPVHSQNAIHLRIMSFGHYRIA